MQTGKPEQKQSVAMSAMAMSAGTLASRILGVVRDMVLAAYFSRTVTDAFVVAFRLPNTFRRLLGEGSLSVSFIPIYIENRTVQAGESPEIADQRARALADGMLTLLVIVSGLICAMGVIFMRPLMAFLVGGEGFLAVEGKLELTIYLSQIMFSYLFLVTLYAYYMAIANAWKKFLIPAMAPACFNLVFVLFALIPDEALGFRPGEYLAWGVLVGGVAQMYIIAHQLKGMKLLPRLRWRPWAVPGAKRVLINMLPGIAGLGVLQIMSLVNVSLASDLPEGSHSYIYWGDRLLEFPQALIAVSIGAALLPSLSQLNAENKLDEMLKLAREHLQLLMFLSLPSALGLFLIAQTLAEALFMRGQFVRADAEMTAHVIQIYSLLLLASGFSRVLVPSFYARKNTWLPATVSGVTLVFHVVVAMGLTRQFGLLGLISATTLSGFFNVILLSACYRWIIGSFGVGEMIRVGLKWLPGLIVMAVWVWVTQFFLLQLWPEGRALTRVVILVVAVGPAIVLYLAVCAAMKVKQAEQVVRTLRRKLQRKKASS
ncbi:MAG: murein biosynthesis integral membrane protein MurJ [Bdellovibrionales bacterium]|nr:murein biosynthesis integral membrane protein MurJ [Bdellovibrionales bacterium]